MVEHHSVNFDTSLGDIHLNNPIIPASGTFGYGYDFNKFYDINILGGISLKGTTYHPRYGNNLPRITETASGLLNAVGLQNVGIHHLIDEEIPTLKKIYNGIIIANICGFSIDEYIKNVQIASTSTDIDIIELNISCPNVHGGGMSFGSDAKLAYKVCSAVKSISSKPIYVKLSPNVTDIVQIAKACESAGIDGLSLINTLLGMRIDIHQNRPILANKTGGLSGNCIFPIALRMVYEVYQSVNIPIIGIGGISNARDVIEMMMAGASAVQIGSANLINPYVCRDILNELEKLCPEMNITNLSDIIGIAHK